MCREIPSVAAELLKCQLPNSYRVLNCKSRKSGLMRSLFPQDHTIPVDRLVPAAPNEGTSMFAWGWRTKGAARVGFSTWAGSCRVHTAAEEQTHRQAGTLHVASVFLHCDCGWHWIQDVQVTFGRVHHPFTHSKLTSMAGSEEQKRAEEAIFSSSPT